MRKMVIDTDTGSDDAVAIMMALMARDVEGVAMTIVAGNVSMEQGSINARYTAQLCGQEIPVYNGATVPIIRDVYRAEFFHGSDGMGEMYYPAPKRQPQALHAVDALIKYIEEYPGIILVMLGPMTNMALAVAKAPHIVKNVSRCVVMGGTACQVGNITPSAEFNIWCDPEAAQVCFKSGLPIEMVGWELCRGAANLVEAEMRYYKEAINTPLSHFTIDCNASALKTNQEWLGDPGIGLPDPVAMAIAINPDLCTKMTNCHVEIECAGVYTRGMTVVDQLNVTVHGTANVEMWRPVNEDGTTPVKVCWELDVAGWKALLEKTVRTPVEG